jgi:hypothetical protein
MQRLVLDLQERHTRQLLLLLTVADCLMTMMTG